MDEFSRLLSSNRNEEESWIATSDMMTGLMMVFLFIVIIYSKLIFGAVEDVTTTTQRLCSQLEDAFDQYRGDWEISICEDGLLVRFENDANFASSECELSDIFSNILDTFYPLLMTVVWDNKDDINELMIEGHTSSEYGDATLSNAYLLNTQLSQCRSRNVMSYVIKLPPIEQNSDYMEWSFNNLTAHGLSSSQLLYDENDNEDRTRSRRVEFRIRTNAQEDLYENMRVLNEVE
jgi:outer membrane protein OmpA-like peptidoglycan-associated protein